jgi:tetratricopeptide (TPR) repeat protein
LKVTHDPVETATAKLGAAQAYKALGDTEAADRILTDLGTSLVQLDLDHIARAAGLETPAELGWSIGKAYVAEGNAQEAAHYLNPEEVSRYASDAASQKNKEGLRLHIANDLPGACHMFWDAAQLEPTNPVFWHNAGRVSFDLGLYRDSMVAFRRAGALEQLCLTDAKKLAVSQAVLGDYQTAQATFEKAELDFTDDTDLARMSASTWAVALAYAAGGWNQAEEAWSRLVLHGGKVPWANQYDIFNHAWVGIRDIAGRARRQDIRYQCLRHESVVYHILGEGLKRGLLNQVGIKEVTQEREATLNRIIDLYRRMLLKPMIPPDVQTLVHKAQPYVDSAADNQESARQAITLYQEVTERAPWWPEGHYALALLLGAYNNDESVDREMNAFLALAPEGPDAVRARQMLETYRNTRILTGPDIER